MNSARVPRTDRQTVGSVVIEAPAIGTKDFFTLVDNETLVALQLVHGTVAGNIVQIDAPKVQLKNPTYSDSDGIAMLTIQEGPLHPGQMKHRPSSARGRSQSSASSVVEPKKPEVTIPTLNPRRRASRTPSSRSG